MNVGPDRHALQDVAELNQKCQRLEREIAREKAARRAAEDIAEVGLRKLYVHQGRLKLLNRISSFANDSDSPMHALRFALQEICEHHNWSVGHALIRIGPQGDERLEGTDIWFSTHQDLAFPFLEASRKILAWPCASAPGRLFLEHSPIWTPDIYAQHGFTRASTAERAGLRASISVPVIMGHELVGAMEFYQTEIAEPSEQLMDILLQIGTQLGRVFKRARHADMLLENAATDPLTGLPNRAAFESEIKSAFDLEKRTAEYQTAVMYIDLDGFKLVNDTLGHNAGDILLNALANRLRHVVETFDQEEWVDRVFLARVGGDEFVILIRSPEVREIANDVANEIHKCLQPIHRIGLNNVQGVASIGIALNGPEYQNAHELLRDADVAMYEAKANGPEQTYHFAPEMRNAALARLELEIDLRRAVETSAFELHFQPIVSLSNRETVGLEALVRWRKEPDVVIMPNDFLPTAEACGLIVPIGTWVLREAFRSAVRFHATNTHNADLYISVNVALQQFQQLHFVTLVRDILLETGANPKWVRLELTESTAATNPGHSARTITQLNAMGIKVSIDDFGTGYSSLAYLQTMPFDTLKIDQSFIKKHLDKSADWSFVLAIKHIADSLGMNVLVEGIENEFQGTELESFGCQFGQGWLFGTPQIEAHALPVGSLTSSDAPHAAKMLLEAPKVPMPR
jgi:diguanylate cyclase (GGDEF)-like protein